MLRESSTGWRGEAPLSADVPLPPFRDVDDRRSHTLAVAASLNSAGTKSERAFGEATSTIRPPFKQRLGEAMRRAWTQDPLDLDSGFDDFESRLAMQTTTLTSRPDVFDDVRESGTLASVSGSMALGSVVGSAVSRSCDIGEEISMWSDFDVAPTNSWPFFSSPGRDAIPTSMPMHGPSRPDSASRGSRGGAEEVPSVNMPPQLTAVTTPRESRRADVRITSLDGKSPARRTPERFQLEWWERSPQESSRVQEPSVASCSISPQVVSISPKPASEHAFASAIRQDPIDKLLNDAGLGDFVDIPPSRLERRRPQHVGPSLALPLLAGVKSGGSSSSREKSETAIWSRDAYGLPSHTISRRSAAESEDVADTRESVKDLVPDTNWTELLDAARKPVSREERSEHGRLSEASTKNFSHEVIARSRSVSPIAQVVPELPSSTQARILEYGDISNNLEEFHEVSDWLPCNRAVTCGAGGPLSEESSRLPSRCLEMTSGWPSPPLRKESREQPRGVLRRDSLASDRRFRDAEAQIPSPGRKLSAEAPTSKELLSAKVAYRREDAETKPFLEVTEARLVAEAAALRRENAEMREQLLRLQRVPSSQPRLPTDKHTGLGSHQRSASPRPRSHSPKTRLTNGCLRGGSVNGRGCVCTCCGCGVQRQRGGSQPAARGVDDRLVALERHLSSHGSLLQTLPSALQASRRDRVRGERRIGQRHRSRGATRG